MRDIRKSDSSWDEELTNLRAEPSSGLRVSHYSQNLLGRISFT